MPVFVACPACGCRVQMVEGTVGQRVRCIACQERFVADPAVQPPPPPPRRPARPPVPSSTPPRDGELEIGPDGRPFCPGCGRRVNWDWIACFHCGEPFDLADDARGPDLERRLRKRLRRDCYPHRGTLIANLGNITLAVGALSLCLFGLGLLVVLPLGVTTMVLATNDLSQMRAGLMDRAGRKQTENGRTAAMMGLVLSLIFSVGWLFMQLTRW